MNFLREALEEPGAPAGGEVLTARAEELSREPGMTESVDLVTARSFGPPAVAAECGVRFLKVGGLMIVSEPPNDEDDSRWPADELGRLGLKPVERIRMGAAYQVLEKIRSTPDTYPRQSGTPKKQPLF